MESAAFDGALRAAAPRRAAPRRRGPHEEVEEEAVAKSPDAPTQVKAGWDMDSGPSSAKARRRRLPKAEQTTEPATSSRNQHKVDDDDDVVIIPDLEDDENTSIALQVAKTAEYQRQVPTIQELDAEIHMALPSAAEMGVDLSVLQAYLTPAAYTKEEDETWDIAWELQNIASEIAKEKAVLDERTKKVEKAGAAAEIEIAPRVRVRA